jgi:hypothetical protein
MGQTPRQRQLTGCRRHLPLQKVTSCSRGMHLSHAGKGFRDFLQSLFAVTCHSSRSAIQAILPILALSLYFTDGGDNNDDNSGDGGDGDDDAGRVTEALLLLVVERYSIQVSWMWRVFYLDYLYHDILLVEEISHCLHDFPWQNIWFDSWTCKKCFLHTLFRKNQLLRIYHQFSLAQLAAQNHGSILVFTGSIEEKIKLSSVVCRLSSVVCRLSSVVCRLSSVGVGVVCRLSSVGVNVVRV